MLPERVSMTFRLSEDACGMIQTLRQGLGVGKTAVVELAIRELVRIKGPQLKRIKTSTSKV